MSVDLQHGDFQPWIVVDDLCGEALAIIEHDEEELLRVEDVTPDGHDMPFGRYEDPRLISLKPPQAPRAIDFDDFRLNFADDCCQAAQVGLRTQRSRQDEEAPHQGQKSLGRSGNHWDGPRTTDHA